VAPDRSSHLAVEAALQPFSPRAALPAVGRLLPSGRSLAFGFALLVLAVVAYLGARTSSVFAIERIRVEGLPVLERESALAALRPLEGRSLVGVERADLERRLAPLPGVLSFDYDRAFPNTLVVRAVAEVPLAVLRRGDESWLVSHRGRVLRRIVRGTLPGLPRVWVPRRTFVAAGTTLADESGGSAVRALALFEEAGVDGDARTVRTSGELTYLLSSGLEIRLGSARAAELKLAAAAAIVPRLESDAAYLDVTVPARPVVGGNLQPGG
jgi:cell division septal protein FtsQ